MHSDHQLRPFRALMPAAALFAVTWGGPAMAQDIDMERIFTCEDQSTLEMEPCNEGRQLVLDNCMSCHPFVQIVLRQYDHGGWESLLRRHHERVPHLEEAEIEAIQSYLAAKFNPDREPPELPDAILEALTDY